MFLPSSEIIPDVGSYNRLTRFAKVLFPEPVPPIIAMLSPLLMSIEISSMAIISDSLYFRVTFSKLIFPLISGVMFFSDTMLGSVSKNSLIRF